jgi:hypothetical protein
VRDRIVFFLFQRVEHGRKCRTSVGRARRAANIPIDKLNDESLLLIDPPVVETFIVKSTGVFLFPYCESSFCSFLKRQLNPVRI